jgi:hypothetical protein
MFTNLSAVQINRLAQRLSEAPLVSTQRNLRRLSC